MSRELASVAIVGASCLVAETIKNAYNTTNVLRDLEIKTNVNLRDNANKTADAVYQSGLADAEMTRNDAIISGVTAGCSGLSVLAMSSSLATPKGEAEVNALDNLTRLKPANQGVPADQNGFGNGAGAMNDELRTALSTSRGLDADGKPLLKDQKYNLDNGKLKASTDENGHTPEEIYGESTGEQKTLFTKNVNKEKDGRTTELSSARQSRMNIINTFTEMSKNICNIGGQSANSAVRANKAAVDKNQSLLGNAQDSLKSVDQRLGQQLDGANADAKQAARALIDQMNNLNARG
jgi:hypothetical protein